MMEADMKFSVLSKVKDLYENDQARAVLEKYLPKLTRSPSFQMTFGMSFKTLCSFAQWNLPQEQLDAADQELRAI